MWPRSGLLLSDPPSDFLLDYLDGYMLFDDAAQIVGHGKHIARLTEQLELFSRLGENVRFDLRCALGHKEDPGQESCPWSSGRGKRPRGGGKRTLGNWGIMRICLGEGFLAECL